MRPVTWTREQIAHRARQRPAGWADRLMAAAIAQTETTVTFDTASPVFRAMRDEFKDAPRDRIEAPIAPAGVVVIPAGDTKPAKPPCTGACPGRELKSLLAMFWLKAGVGDHGCNCNAHAAQMDEWGPDGCEANIDTIIGWLREEWEKRQKKHLVLKIVPFMETAARELVATAIERARGKAVTAPASGSSPPGSASTSDPTPNT